MGELPGRRGPECLYRTAAGLYLLGTALYKLMPATLHGPGKLLQPSPWS